MPTPKDTLKTNIKPRITSKRNIKNSKNQKPPIKQQDEYYLPNVANSGYPSQENYIPDFVPMTGIGLVSSMPPMPVLQEPKYEEIEEIKGFESYLILPRNKKEYVNQITSYQEQSFSAGYAKGFSSALSMCGIAMMTVGFLLLKIIKIKESSLDGIGESCAHCYGHQ